MSRLFATVTIDGFDLFAFLVIAVLLLTAVVIIVLLGGLPGKIAASRNHPYAKAVAAAGWISLVTLGAVADRVRLGLPTTQVEQLGEGRRPHTMIAFMTIIYTAAIVLVFKVLKVRPRPWPIAIFATAGVLMLGTVVVLWTQAAPISTRAVVSRYVVQLVPYVKGQVTSIPSKPNEPLKKGDVLFEIDPRRTNTRSTRSKRNCKPRRAT